MVFEGLKVWIGLLFQQSVELLDHPFSEEKIHNVVLHLNKEKSLVQMVSQLLFIKSVGR